MVQVLKQALEALELALRSHGVMLLSDPPQDAWKTYGVDGNARQAIASLRQAIREHAMYEVQRLGQEIEQEPVATVTSETEADITMSWWHEPAMSWWHEPALPIGTKLFTHPPQRTEQEPVAWREVIKDLSDKYARAVVEFAKNIEKGANSMSPIAREAGDLLLALHTAIDAAPPERTKIEFYRLPQRTEQESVAFLANAMRFKLSFDSEGKVNCFWNQKELDGRWVALVAAEDDCHLKLTHPPQHTEQNFCPRCGKRTNDIHTCTPPQENT